MFKINLKRAIQCPTGDKAVMRIGIHNIDDETYAHWFIQGLLAQGDIVVLQGQPDVNPIQVKVKAEKKDTVVWTEVKPIPAKKYVAPVVKEPEVIIEEVVPEAPVVVEVVGKTIKRRKKK